MKTLIRSILLIASLLIARHAVADYVYHDYKMNPVNVSSVTVTNRSSNTNFTVEVQISHQLWGITTPTPPEEPLHAAGTGDDFFVPELPSGGYCFHIPEYQDCQLIDIWQNGSEWINACGLFLYGTTIEGEDYSYDDGEFYVSIVSHPDTVISLDSWVDGNGSLHLVYYVDDAP